MAQPFILESVETFCCCTLPLDPAVQDRSLPVQLSNRQFGIYKPNISDAPDPMSAPLCPFTYAGEIYLGCGALCGGERFDISSAVSGQLQDRRMETQDTVHAFPRAEVGRASFINSVHNSFCDCVLLPMGFPASFSDVLLV